MQIETASEQSTQTKDFFLGKPSLSLAHTLEVFSCVHIVTSCSSLVDVYGVNLPEVESD